MAIILIVDDRAINRQFLATLLGYRGHRIIEAEDGQAALLAASRERPDLVISDILMPNMDGIEFAKCLHAQAAYANVPIIFYTATYRVNDARDLGAACGVLRVLPKPSEPQLILDTVAEVLSEYSGSDEVLSEPAKITDPTVSDRRGDVDRLEQRLRHAVELGQSIAVGREGGEQLVSTFRDVQAMSLRLSALLELGLDLGAQRDAQALVETCCRAGQDIMSARYAGVGIFNGDKRLLRYAVCGVPESTRAAFASMGPRLGVFGAAMATGKLCRVYDGEGDLSKLGLPREHPSVKQMLVVPVCTVTRCYGWIYIADKQNELAFDDTDEQFAETLAAQLAQAYENLWMFDEVQSNADMLRAEIAERKKAEHEKDESDRRFVKLFQSHPVPMWIYDRHSLRFVAVNTSAMVHYGYDESEFLGMTIKEVEPSNDRDTRARKARQTYGSALVGVDVLSHKKKDGTLIDVEISSHTLSLDGRDCKFVIAQDVTARLLVEEKNARLSRITSVLSGINSAIVRIRDRQELFNEACRIAVDNGAFRVAWVGEIDPATGDGKVVAWRGGEASFVESLRVTARPGTLDSNSPSSVAVREGRPIICNDVARAPIPSPLRENLLGLGHRAIAALPLQVDGKVVGVISLLAGEVGFFDDAELKLLTELAGDVSFGMLHIERERQINYLALYDPLTGLPNRNLFLDRLSQFVNVARHDRRPLAVIVLDLDHFKQVNDTLGRHAGDEVLRETARRWNTELREPYTLARLGADTFAIAVADLSHNADATIVLNDRLLAPLARPFAGGEQLPRISAHGGIALFPGDGQDAESLLSNAEAALKQALATGERHLYFDPAINASTAAKLRMEVELRAALDEHQFILHYQPRVDLTTGQIVGAEALIRWQHPRQGIISPVNFIGLAEETGLIIPIGDWVIRTVCAQQASWLDQNIDVVPVALNLSAVQFHTGRILETLREALATYGLAAKHLELELTESAVMEDPEVALRTLEAFRRLGLKLSLDDFGTGYSSLAYVKRFPFDYLKIDRTFVTGITQSAGDAAIANAVIALARQLKLRTVAEGVETEGQLNYLRQHGCDEMQGFYFSEPVPAEDFAALLSEGHCLSVRRQSNASKHTVLIVDDELEMQARLKRILRQDGYKVLTARCGEDALETLALEPVQVIVSDQRMPSMSGTEFLSVAKELYPDTVRIILSDYADLQVVADSMNHGVVFKLLTKPWQDDLLREQVRDAFRRYRPLANRLMND